MIMGNFPMIMGNLGDLQWIIGNLGELQRIRVISQGLLVTCGIAKDYEYFRGIYIGELQRIMGNFIVTASHPH